MCLNRSGAVTFFRFGRKCEDAQENARVLIVVTEFGIMTLFKLLQSQKAPSPIVVTELGMVTLSKLSQKQNTKSSIEVTALEIVTLFKLRHI